VFGEKSVKYLKAKVNRFNLEGQVGVIKFILHLFGWLATIIFQIVASYLIIFLFSIIFSGVDTTSRLGWVASLLIVWLGYLIGINLIGQIALRWVWRGIRVLSAQRLLGTAIGAFIPLLILLPIGYSVPVGNTGTRFYDLVTNNWQPILAQASLFAAILGYYIPGMFKINREPIKTAI
jgi:glucan phosphoethanolaminetransferase (alkaline phosphatase superfamily)